MKLIAFNGSPRKKWNTAKLLQSALEGAKSLGAETKMYHLYDMNFHGCISCMQCKRLGGESFGRCAVRDELTPVLDELTTADALLLGSPIYFGAATGEMRSFIERAFFPFLIYGPELTCFPNQIKTAFIYTMNITQEYLETSGYMSGIENIQAMLKRMFTLPPELFFATDTRQVEDYSQYDIRMFDTASKVRRDEEHFPLELQRAFELGKRLVTK